MKGCINLSEIKERTSNVLAKMIDLIRKYNQMTRWFSTNMYFKTKKTGVKFLKNWKNNKVHYVNSFTIQYFENEFKKIVGSIYSPLTNQCKSLMNYKRNLRGYNESGVIC